MAHKNRVNSRYGPLQLWPRVRMGHYQVGMVHYSYGSVHNHIHHIKTGYRVNIGV